MDRKKTTDTLGGVSDPFQPCEKHFKVTKRALEIFAETQYPVVISSKGRLLGDTEYLDLIAKCNAVVQISMMCSSFDKIEPGCPTFEERLKILSSVSKVAKRTIVRCQPYLPELKNEVLVNIRRFKEAGAYGVIFEAMKFIKMKPGLEKLAGDCVFPVERLRADFLQLRDECHKNDLKFFSGENRLRTMGDSLCCCGFEGLHGFEPNTYNANHILLDKSGKSVKSTSSMNIENTGYAIMHHLHQDAKTKLFRGISYKEMVNFEIKNNPTLKKVLG